MGLELGMTLKFYTSVTKGLKLKVRKFFGLLSTFLEVTAEKLVRMGEGGGGFLQTPPPSPSPPPPAILNTANTKIKQNPGAAQIRNIMQSSSSFIRISGPIPEYIKKPALINDQENIGKNPGKTRRWEKRLVCSKYSWRV